MNPVTKWQTTKQQPRRLLCFAAAFSFILLLGVLCFPYGVRLALWTSMAAAVLLAAALVLLWGRRYVLAAAGALCAAVWFALFCAALLPAMREAEGTHEFALEVLTYSEGHTAYGTVTGRILEMDGEKARGLRAEVFLQDGSPAFEPGQRLRFRATGAPGRRMADGLFVRLSQNGAIEQEEGKPSLQAKFARWSHALSARIDSLLTGDEAALCKALLTGDRSGFSPRFRRALSLSGAAHIASVSGMHVSILAAFAFAVFGKRWGSLISLPMLFAFAALTGFVPSVLRAVIMTGVALLAFCLRQEADTLTSLFFALMLLLAFNPFSALSPSLQLSFGATLGLVLFTPRLTEACAAHLPTRPVPRRMVRTVALSLCASVAALAFSLPISALYFARLSTVSLLTNLLILWAVSLAMMLAIPILALSFVWEAGASFAAAWLLRPVLGYVTHMTKWLAALPLAHVRADNWYLWISLCALAVALIAFYMRKLPFRWGVLSLAAVVAVCTVFGVAEAGKTGQLSVFGADGAAVAALHTEEGTLLLNCGRDSARSARTLDQALFASGIAEAELLVTKNDEKTAGGLARLRATIPLSAVYRPEGDEMPYEIATQTYRDGGTLARSGAAVELLHAGDAYAARVFAGERTVLFLCGVRPIDFFVDAARRDTAADVLVIDGAYYRSRAAMERLSAMTGAQRALCADDGFESLPAKKGGVSLFSLSEAGTINYLFRTR